MGLYLLGFAAGLAAALVLKYTLKTTEQSYFIMELPVYRKPQWQTIGTVVLNKVKVFLFDAGKIILAISIVLWFLTSHAANSAFEKIEQNAIQNTNISQGEVNSQKLEASYAGILGKKMEPPD